ncbi:hypothetical protein GCK32_017040, partial [Trichostrongylus colubriformis]
WRDVYKSKNVSDIVRTSSTSLARHDRAGSRRSISSAVSHQTAYIADAPLGDKRGRGGGIFRLYLARLRRSPLFWACLVGSILRGMELPLHAYFTGLSYSALEQTAETFTSFMWLAVGSNIFLALYSWAFLTISIGFGGWSSAITTTGVRVKVLNSLLSQEMEFFDRPQCNNAACVAELSTKAPDIQAVFICHYAYKKND